MQSQASFPTKLGATMLREEFNQHPLIKPIQTLAGFVAQTFLWCASSGRLGAKELFSRSGLRSRVLLVWAPFWGEGVLGGDGWLDPSHLTALRS